MIRKSNIDDLDRILEIFEYARGFMVSQGNPNQWAKRGHPSKEYVLNHINDNMYVVEENNAVLAVFVLAFGIDPTYLKIEGKWINDNDYVTIHAIAKGKDGKGIFNKVVDYALTKCDNVRIDTHEDNMIMQHLITSYGFKYCGIIYVSDGTPRLAYQYVK